MNLIDIEDVNDELIAPLSAHLVMFYIAKIEEECENIPLDV
jgi:hypothetical protein